jgi:hypothetical protein
MPIRGRVQSIDLCIADIVAALNAANIVTVALEDGRELSCRMP